MMYKKINCLLPIAAANFIVSVAMVDYSDLVIVTAFVLMLFISKIAFSYLGEDLAFDKRIYILIALSFIYGHLISANVVEVKNVAEKIAVTEIRGRVVQEAQQREKYQRFVIEVHDQYPGARFMVTTNPYQKIAVGDELIVSGTLESPKDFETDSGRMFTYERYLRARGITGIISFANINKIHDVQSEFSIMVSLERRLSNLKSKYLDVLGRYIPEPHSSLAGGITVGANDALGEDIDELFRRVGLTHIVVLSGYNIAIVVIAIGGLLAFMPYWAGATLSFIGIWLFVLLVGASTTVVRAGIMASVAVFSRLYGNQISGLSLLSIAVIIMVALNPLLVAGDPSFQLSVLATLGIIVVAPLIEPYFKFITKKFGIREIIVTSLATQIMVVPWIIYLIGDFSVVAPLVNVLVLPMIPFAMGFAFLTFLLDYFSAYIASVSSFITYGLLEYVFLVSNLFGNFSYSKIALPPISLPFVGISYLLILFCLTRLKPSLTKSSQSP